MAQIPIERPNKPYDFLPKHTEEVRLGAISVQLNKLVFTRHIEKKDKINMKTIECIPNS